MRIEEYILDNSSRWSNNIAAIENNFSIEYSTLITNARQIAIVLKDLGVKRGDRICILSERNIDGLTVILAILFAGAIYVPISLDYPSSRIKYIVEDSQPRLLIIDDHLKNRIRLDQDCRTVGQLKENISKKIYQKDSSSLSGDDVAYILYTSGSTGSPKGVMVSHKAVLNTLFWMRDTFRIKEQECIAQKTPWGFTDSIWELFLPLLVGGKIGFISDDQVKDSVQLYNKLNDIQAVITQFVPPVLSVFLETVAQEIRNPEFTSLRWILNGGEELTRKLVDRWFDIFKGIGYANPYGMTESAIYATNFMMKEKPVWGMRKIPIGLPINNEQVYILSERNEILGKEIQGEICIGGESLMNGYWNNDKITRAVLIKHPQINGLIYKSGDYGMIRADGLIVYLGRKDNQVNIRGMRVELNEIKHVLLEIKEILQAAIIVKGEDDNKFIVAFYSTKNEQALDTDKLFMHIRNYLPEYMVPGYFVHLNEFPLTEHNKIDYGKIQNQKINLSQEGRTEISASNRIETVLIHLWEDALGHKNFTKGDAFFNIGGNSLLVMKVYSNIPDEYKYVLKISNLIEYPSIKSLSDYIKSRVENITEIDGNIHNRSSKNLRKLKEIRKKIND